jgi:hypothetical protein
MDIPGEEKKPLKLSVLKMFIRIFKQKAKHHCYKYEKMVYFRFGNNSAIHW